MFSKSDVNKSLMHSCVRLIFGQRHRCQALFLNKKEDCGIIYKKEKGELLW